MSKYKRRIRKNGIGNIKEEDKHLRQWERTTPCSQHIQTLKRISSDSSIHLQIQNPSNAFEVYERSVSSGDHSFVAAHDGKYEYCFSNEHWSANSKEVSFNVHGIVYVPESEAPQDPLEKEGKCRAPNIISRPVTRVANIALRQQSSSSPNSSPKSKTSKATSSSANAPTATPPRAPTPASSGGASSRCAS
jgi:hypothetical protein